MMHSWGKVSLVVLVLGSFLAFNLVYLVSFPEHALAAEVTIDATVSTTATSHGGATQSTVFVSDQVGYAFYRDSNRSCVYAKTTNGGTSWGTAVTVDAQTDCLRVVVWFDRWTPGDSTGNYIHISTIDSGSDDVWYTRLDTSSDTLTTTVNATGANQGGTYSAGSNFQSITKGTDGTLYMGIADNSDAFVIECSTTCTSAGNWTETGTNPLDLTADSSYLSPLASGDILLINNDVSADDFRSKVWHNGSGSWDGSWTTIDANAPDNTAYGAAFSASVDQLTNDVYLVYAADIVTLGTNDDIRTAIYSGGSWTLKTDVITDTSIGITGASISRDANTGDVYVVYSGRTNPGAGTTANVYWKKSTDSMASWGTEQGPINTTADDIYGASPNTVNNERIYVTWVGANVDDLFGITIADLTPPTYTQSAYRAFSNADSTNVGSALASQDTSATLSSAGSAFRIRQLLHVSGDGARANLDTFKLQFVGKGTGTCASPSGGTPSTYTDVTGSTVIAYNNNATPADGSVLTANANDPTHSTHTIINQTYEEANNFTNSQGKILGGEDGKWDFSLKDNSAPGSTTYCLRAVHSDGTTLSSYSVYPEISTSGGNSLPVASSISIDSGAGSITLIEGTTKSVVCTGTVTDSNGFSDIQSVTAVLYRTSVGTGGADDNNNKYTRSGDAQCVPSGGSGSSETYTCTFAVQYYADATDTGSPNASDDWSCTMTPSDTVGAGTSASDTIEMNSLLALDVTTSINYGSVSPSGDTGATNQTVVVTNTGNRDIDPELSGVALAKGGDSLAVTQQKYSLTAFTYSSGGTALTTTPTTLNALLPQRTVDTGGGEITDDILWGIGVPNGTRRGVYTGTNTITAVSGL